MGEVMSEPKSTLVAPVLVALCTVGSLLATPGCDDPEQAAEVAPPAPVAHRVMPIPTANDCTDPGWSRSLRCQALAHPMAPAEAPQENWGTAPRQPDQIKESTRVFVGPDETARCFDGTMPVIYVDAAATPSDKWVISFTGGGACVPQIDPGTGLPQDGTECTATYEAEDKEMGTAYEPPMKDLNPAGGWSGGINNPDPAVNAFADYNRVRIEKCNYDRYIGRSTFIDVQGDFGGQAVTYDAYQEGRAVVAASLQALSGGLTYTTWSAHPVTGAIITDNAATLPPLQDAETILFVGHSGAAHGLMHNIDALADQLTASGVTADIRALFDANFIESGDNEAAFADDVATGKPLDGDFWSGHSSGASVASAFTQAGGAGYDFVYDLANYYTDLANLLPSQLEYWQAALDQSCLDVHVPAGDAWRCSDRMHVLLNHVSTPMFIREDFTDPNKEHTLGGVGHPVIWADKLTGAACASVPEDPCHPLLSMAEHRLRLEAQADAVVSSLATESEMGRQDTSLVDQRPTVFMWMPDCTNHNGAYDSNGFFNTSLTAPTTPISMHDWLTTFMDSPRHDVVKSLVDGVGSVVSSCP